MDNSSDERNLDANALDSSLTVAVVMATYNGSQFIEEQMDSIRRQSRPAQRVIIRDDGSIDGTQTIIREYIKRYGLTSWDFAENKFNKGFTNNFIDAALEATEDVVFFSDQDDIWLISKIEHSMLMFAQHADCLAVLCDARVVDEHGAKADTLQTVYRHTGSHFNRVDFASQVASMVASGHTLSVKRGFLEMAASVIQKYDLTYDSPIGLLAAAYGGLYKTGTVDVLHRVHSSNTSLPLFSIRQRLNNRSWHLAGRKFQLKVLESCRDQLKEHLDEKALTQLDAEISARRQSLEAIESGRLLPILVNLIRVSPMKNVAIEITNLAIVLFGKG